MPEGTELDVEIDDQEQDAQEGRKRGGMIAVLVTALAGLGVGGAVGAKTLAPMVGTALAERAPDPSEAPSEGEGSGAPAALHVIDNLVVNPAHSGGTRFLLTSIAVEVENPGDLSVLVQRDVELRDALIVTLGAKTVDELTDIGNRSELADEIFQALSRVVGKNVIRRIYIPQFVIQ